MDKNLTLMRYFLFFVATFVFFLCRLSAQPSSWITKDSVLYVLKEATSEAKVIGSKAGANLKKVVFPSKIRVGENEYTVTEISSFTSANLEEITIPASVKTINPLAFGGANSYKLKVITLPSNAPTKWFANNAFQQTSVDKIKFADTPENFIQQGNLLYSKSRKTLYDIRMLHDTIFFIPDEVDSVYFNFVKWPSPYHFVLHKNVKFFNGKQLRSNKRLYLAIPKDEPTGIYQAIMEGTIPASSISLNLDNVSFNQLPYRYQSNLRDIQYKDKLPFVLDIEKDEGVDSVSLDYVYSLKPDERNKHVVIRENTQEKLSSRYVPINIGAVPKQGKRIVGYIYFNDTIVGEKCTVSGSIAKQRIFVKSANVGELIDGFDYKLSPDKSILYKWIVNSSLADLRNVTALAQVRELASFSLDLKHSCNELFLFPNLETINAECLNSPNSLEFLAFPSSIKNIHSDAWRELLSVERIYIQGEAPIERAELEKAFLLHRPHIQKILVDAEALAFWKNKLDNSPLLPLLSAVETEATIINTDPNNIVVTVQRLDTNQSIQLDAQNSSLKLPRATPVKITLRNLVSYDLRKLIVNDKEQETLTKETFALGTLRVASKGETVHFRVKTLPSTGGEIVVKRLDGKEFEENAELLRGTQLHITIKPTAPYIFKQWTLNGQVAHSLDTILEVRQHLILAATFYRRKALVNFEEFDRRIKLTLLDSKARTHYFEKLYEGDTVFLQSPDVPEGQEITTFEIDGEPVTQFPHQLVVSVNMKFKASLLPKLCQIKLSETAAKYLEIKDENGTPLILTAPLPYDTYFTLTFRGKKSERLEKLLINKVPYSTTQYSLEFSLKENIEIDVEVKTLFDMLHVTLPPTCTLTINESEIKQSSVYKAEHGTPLTIKANSGEAYTVTGLQLDGMAPTQGFELTFELLRNRRLTVLATPKSVELTFASTGNGQLVVYDKENVVLENHTMIYCGEKISIEPLADPQHECTKLTVNGEDVEPKTTKVEVNGALNIQATFSPFTYENYNGIYINRRNQEIVGCIPDMVKMKLDFDQDFEIANKAFSKNVNLKEVDILQGVSSIGVGAFAASKINRVRLGACVTDIKRDAFAECHDLLLVDLEHENPASLKLTTSALAPRKREGFILRVPNSSVENYSSHTVFSRFKIVPAQVSYYLEGDQDSNIQNIRVEKCEYWASDRDTYDLPVGSHDLPGGTRITFQNDENLQEKIEALYVNNKRVKLPYTHVFLKPVIFRVKMEAPKQTTAAEDAQSSHQLQLFPNPTKNSITVTTTLPLPVKYSLYNSQGKNVQVGVLHSLGQVVDLDKLPEGLYFLHIPTTTGKDLVQKFVKE